MAEDKALLARLDLAIDKLSDVSADIKAVLQLQIMTTRSVMILMNSMMT